MISNLEQIKAATDIVSVIGDYINLEKQMGEYVGRCPFHNEKTASFKVNPTAKKYYCFGCGEGGDALKFLQDYAKMPFIDAVKNLANRTGITIEYDDKKPTKASKKMNTPTDSKKQQPLPPAEREQQQPLHISKFEKHPLLDTGAVICYDYYNKCQQALFDSDEAKAYLQQRGISIATARKHLLGYDSKTKRIVIPMNASTYMGRLINDALINSHNPKTENTPKTNGTMHFFNEAGLYGDDEYIFIVEGAFDALSISEIGFTAVALNGAPNYKAFTNTILEYPPDQHPTYILCLDNDDAGKTAQSNMADMMRMQDIRFIEFNIAGEYKDANEALTSDRNAFIKAVEAAQNKASIKPDSIANYLQDSWQDDIKKMAEYSGIKTGFVNIDNKFECLYPGLYVIAAISSLGKTTFASQIADNIAKAGNEVLFFSLEMSRFEMASKSLARACKEANNKSILTSLAIRKGHKGVLNYEAIKQEYANTTAKHLSVIEGNFNCNVEKIREDIKRFIRQTGKRPVVFIDYLQVITPTDKRDNTKVVIDDAVVKLKQLTRELNITLFIVSSVNRANYLTPIDFESLKESGSIEYTADVVWGLQLACLNEPLFDAAANTKIAQKRARVKRAKNESPRKIELVNLKNRYGKACDSLLFEYYPAQEYFEPTSESIAQKFFNQFKKDKENDTKKIPKDERN